MEISSKTTLSAYSRRVNSSKSLLSPATVSLLCYALPFPRKKLREKSVTNEGSLFAYNAATPSDVSAFISANYPELSSANLTTINSLYPLMAPIQFHNAYFPSASAAYGEATFICPGTTIAQCMSNAGLASQVWNYHFNQPNTFTLLVGDGVAHNTDLGAMFGGFVNPTNGAASALFNLEAFDAYNPGGENVLVKSVMMPYLISFVRFLDPNEVKNELAPTWVPVNEGGTLQRILLQNTGSTMETVPGDLLARCDFWNDLIPLTGQ